MLSQLTFGTSPDGVVIKLDLSQWQPIAIFLKKIIQAEIQYKTHDGELLAIDEAFKIWRHYLKSCKYKIFVLIDHNNLGCSMKTKSLSSK